MKVAPEALSVLSTGEIEGNIFRITGGQLDRKLYQNVNEVLENIGGKWNRKLKGHVFEGDPTDKLEEVLLTGETVNEKKLYQFFETPRAVADRIIELAEIEDGMSVLEPEAGRGALVDAITASGCGVVCVELDPKHIPVLRDKGYYVREADFLTLSPETPFPEDLGDFQRIIMNPPFTRQQDIAHVLHAYNMLREGGRLVSVMALGFTFRQDKKSTMFRELVEQHGFYEEVPENAFKESGTGVRTVLVLLDK